MVDEVRGDSYGTDLIKWSSWHESFLSDEAREVKRVGRFFPIECVRLRMELGPGPWLKILALNLENDSFGQALSNAVLKGFICNRYVIN